MNINSEFENKAEGSLPSIMCHPAIDLFLDDWIDADPENAKCTENESNEINELLKDEKNLEVFKELLFIRDAHAFPYSVIFQDGFEEYIEDLVSGSGPNKCSAENRANILTLLQKHPSQIEAMDPAINYEEKNGAGSLKRDIDESAKFVQARFEEYFKHFEM